MKIEEAEFPVSTSTPHDAFFFVGAGPFVVWYSVWQSRGTASVNPKRNL
jgi:hypothetical protein